MIDPIVSLAFGLHSRKGAYAVLLGSGVSRSAAIPTGWDITLDLVRKLAAVKGKDSGQDPAAWYQTEHGDEPRYDELLAALAKTPDERQGLLRSYFEPTEEEQEKGHKQPTPAHKAVACLVREGYIRVIVTTNFDRLMEAALEEAGVFPEVVTTPDQIKGATPLSQVKCLVVKVHGDYRDTRIKNTPAELAQYDPAMDALLDRLFDEFGLIVCGWSADWDPALRAAIERCPSRRYTMYWTDRKPLGEIADRLVQSRQGEFIQIAGADRFFEDLVAKVSALDSITSRHPLSPAIAAAEVKRYIAEDRFRIRLADLVRDETERVYRSLYEEAQFPLHPLQDLAELPPRIERYESITEVLLSIVATGCYWGDARHNGLWVDTMNRLGNAPSPAGVFNDLLQHLRWYPVLLLLYGGGIAAIASGEFDTLTTILRECTVWDGVKRRNVGKWLSADWVLAPLYARQVFSTGQYLPLNQRLDSTLRNPLRTILPDDRRYADAFDKFEYYLGLTCAGWDDGRGANGRGPLGLFAYRYHEEDDWLEARKSEIEKAGEAHPLLHGGLFGGSLANLMDAQMSYHESIAHRAW